MNTFKMALLNEIIYINPFILNVHFDSPENIRKPFLFLMFSGGQKVALGRNELMLCLVFNVFAEYAFMKMVT